MGFFKDRRNKIIVSRLQAMTTSGHHENVWVDVYFDAACQYAKDRGGEIYSDMKDVISFEERFANKNYSITFLKNSHVGGTQVTITESLDLAGKFILEITANPMRDAVDNIIKSRQPIYVTSEIKADNIKAFYDLYCNIIPPILEIDGPNAICIGLAEIPGSGNFFITSSILNGEATVIASSALEISENPGFKAEISNLQKEFLKMYCEAIDDRAGP